MNKQVPNCPAGIRPRRTKVVGIGREAFRRAFEGGIKGDWGSGGQGSGGEASSSRRWGSMRWWKI